MAYFQIPVRVSKKLSLATCVRKYDGDRNIADAVGKRLLLVGHLTDLSKSFDCNV